MSPSVTFVAERALPSRGGLAVATTRIAEQAAARGEEVHLVVVGKEAPPGGRQTSPHGELTVHTVGRLPEPDQTLAALVDHATDVARAAGSTLIHGVYASAAGFAATVVAGRLRRPSVVSLRGNDLDRGLYRRDEHGLVMHAITRATVLTGVSRALCETAAGLIDRPVWWVGNSVDAERFRPESKDNSLVASMGLGSDAVIGYSGELREKKGMRFLLPAFAALLRERPAHLLLLGGVRHEAQAAFDEFLRLAPEAAARVQVVGYQRSPKRLSRLLALCDLMVFPSLMEGMPNAVLEAMACARPVLATAVGGHLDLVEHGRTGALLPLDGLDLLPQAIAELLELPEREALGRAAREHVITHHHPAAESAAWAEVYERARAIGGPSAARVHALYPRAADSSDA
ncbi:MAG: glycosyltransferase [Myxococcales bacterium]|nr:glycosyltransferase [Myxococcales bacterium]